MTHCPSVCVVGCRGKRIIRRDWPAAAPPCVPSPQDKQALFQCTSTAVQRVATLLSSADALPPHVCQSYAAIMVLRLLVTVAAGVDCRFDAQLPPQPLAVLCTWKLWLD